MTKRSKIHFVVHTIEFRQSKYGKLRMTSAELILIFKKNKAVATKDVLWLCGHA
jgi:hypothetical protein